MFTLCLYGYIYLTYCRTEREKYAKHRYKSRKHPEKYLSVIIDGMDQDKTDIPHIITNPKALAGSFRLETHITGVQAHGHCTLMVIDCGQFPHDTNLTIEALVQLFQHLKVCMYILCGIPCNYAHDTYIFILNMLQGSIPMVEVIFAVYTG